MIEINHASLLQIIRREKERTKLKQGIQFIIKKLWIFFPSRIVHVKETEKKENGHDYQGIDVLELYQTITEMYILHAICEQNEKLVLSPNC